MSPPGNVKQAADVPGKASGAHSTARCTRWEINRQILAAIGSRSGPRKGHPRCMTNGQKAVLRRAISLVCIAMMIAVVEALTWKHRVLRRIGHQLWLPGRDRVLRLFAHPDTQKPVAFETDLLGVPYSGDLGNFIDWTVYFSGAFAPHELRLLADLAAALRAQGKPVDFFDIGANIGHHSLFMSRHADRIFGFEPFAPVRERMTAKLRHAGVTNVTLFPVALGASDGTGTFYAPSGANQGTGTLSGHLPENASAEPTSIPVLQGDSFFATQHLPPISLLKLDVEDYELEVLRGLRETLRRDRPPVLVELPQDELTQAGGDARALLDDLLYADYRVLAVTGNRLGRYVLAPFKARASAEALILPADLARSFAPARQALGEGPPEAGADLASTHSRSRFAPTISP